MKTSGPAFPVDQTIRFPPEDAVDPWILIEYTG